MSKSFDSDSSKSSDRHVVTAISLSGWIPGSDLDAGCLQAHPHTGTNDITDSSSQNKFCWDTYSAVNSILSSMQRTCDGDAYCMEASVGDAISSINKHADEQYVEKGLYAEKPFTLRFSVKDEPYSERDYEYFLNPTQVPGFFVGSVHVCDHALNQEFLNYGSFFVNGEQLANHLFCQSSVTEITTVFSDGTLKKQSFATSLESVQNEMHAPQSRKNNDLASPEIDYSDTFKSRHLNEHIPTR